MSNNVWGNFNVSKETTTNPEKQIEKVKEETKGKSVEDKQKALDKVVEQTKEFSILTMTAKRNSQFRVRKTIEIDMDIDQVLGEMVEDLKQKDLMLIDGQSPTKQNIINYVLRKTLIEKKVK